MFTEHLKQTKKEKFDGISILDALSASGLRTIRFSKELKDIKKICANDISKASHKLMMDNFKLNNLDLEKIDSKNIYPSHRRGRPHHILLLSSDSEGRSRAIIRE